jgi:undecaprenyl-diphosphatase
VFTYFQAIIFGVVQGVTELFPISSLGHSVVLPKLLGWNIQQKDPFFLTFLVLTHTATALVLFFFFWKDWKKIAIGLLRSLKNREINENDSDAKLGWLLIVATIPAGILGILFEQPLKDLFASPQLVAFVLILNGLLLFFTEFLRKRKNETTHNGSDSKISKISFSQALKVGILQCLALIPGFSRTGSTITGGLIVGLSHTDAARFSFLLATPIIGAASVLKISELTLSSDKTYLGPMVVGAICAGISAFLSVKFLTKYFETKNLTPFAVYCVVAGVILSLLFLFR